MKYTKVTTLEQFLLQEEKKFPDATGSFTLLMTIIEDAGKIIASHVKRSGLVDILGQAGSQNSYGEDVQKLDEFTNELLSDMLLGSGLVSHIASEEHKDVIHAKKKGLYSVYFDPLDGSSNIDTNNSIGTIFSIYKSEKDILPKGKKQVAAGYIIYGPTVMFVYSRGDGVNGFTLDPSIGSFLLSHPNIKIPESGVIYSINEAYYEKYDEANRAYLDSLKKEKSKLRFVGSMVADVHRTLVKGGIFLYPKDSDNPHGKLRLLFEVNPMSFLVRNAGGDTTSDGIDPLTITAEKLTQKVPIALGSRENVKTYLSFIKKPSRSSRQS